MAYLYGGRTFDRIERVDPRSFNHLLVTSGIAVSAEDKVLQKQIDALKVRLTADEAAIAALQGGTPPAPSPTPTPMPAATIWPCGVVLDQGQFGMCVGYAWAGWAMTGPSPKLIVSGVGGDDEGATADLLYDKAQDDDGSPEDPQTGASTTGGAQASVQLGFAASYSWALNVDQIVAAIVGHGPVVVGVPWRSTMMNPDAHGVINCGDKSQDVGGHETVLFGYYPAGAPGNPSNVEAMVEQRQSWGDWGPLHGNAFWPLSGLASLMADGGDAAVATKHA